ncbi:hypothetical protein [Bradyrhizobium sp. UNPF46]|uniref:hypothetical protein n=1 Tax=Bradyrhizobium sp. UNPF46 TaxID=1141168 RepID=UPI0015F03570|nr:hypothetical protein [Bradyrhizobium sp. UNPF46]
MSYGKPYLVGENGPELFVPGMSGRIESNDKLRSLTSDGAAAVAHSTTSVTNNGAVAFNPTFNIAGGDPREVAGQVQREMRRFLAELESEQRGYLSD